ncbi:dna repair protein-like protein rad18 [Lindgomyces ingoldianus]|uniref:Dna repair protein-like protein rad18 n=1 Tax=Lindgomyces ingoldianus TaxID=673940 RepID=A0ACB6QKC5_9PLEO|nr:dna repair protein-like protein rad18 [Lindgomyces ingoldianus]KAF2466767.1 dna repair protein-like protein rad18 [Lindgomyces ingoldianus]
MAPIPPSKRRRAHTDDFETVESDAGDTRRSRTKRPRQTASPDFGSDASSIEEDTASVQSRAPAEQVPDGVDEDGAFYQRATQVVERQLRESANRKNVPAEQGIVEEIRCTNFMCHEQLTVTLGPLINFIIGHNGSGKSAVLTALTLCLGGKATSTNRGQNLKSFIKEGRDFCVLSVKIKNQGSAAFKPDVYGRSIIVERHFNKAGTSGFKLKDVNGRTVSTKKAELEDIIDAFALQIDNPMNVLTQDMARQFLNDSSAKDKYKFFLKGTQLESLNNEYVMVDERLQELIAKAQVVNADVEVYRKRFEKATEKARRAANLETMRAREKLLMNQMAWAEVEAKEKELGEIDDEIERVNQIIHERTVEADDASRLYEQANQAWSNANQSIQDRQSELLPVEQERADLRAQFDETKSRLLKMQTVQRQIGGQISSKQKAINDYEAQIREHRQRQIEADNGLHAQKTQELEEAKEHCENLKAKLETHGDGLPELNQRLRSAQGKRMQTNDHVQQKQEEIRRSKKTINDIENGQRNWMDSYPNPANLHKLLRAIGEERRFHERPIGPIGRHIKLQKLEWSSILEKQAGGTLNAFVVTSRSDQNLLSSLMKRTNYQSAILIGNDQRIDTSRHEPPPDMDTWMRAIKIDNNLVRNQMIINHAIDQIVLLPSRKSGQDFMHDGGSRRVNVKAVYTFSDKNPRKGHAINFNPQSGAVNMGPILEYVGATRMQADKEPQLRAERSNLERLQRELQELQGQAKELQGQLNACQHAINEHEKQKKRLTVQFQEAQSAVENLEEELNAATPDAGLIAQLEKDLREVKNDKKFIEQQYQDNVTEKDDLDKSQRKSKADLDAAQARLERLNIELGKAEAKASKLSHRREQALREKNRSLEEANEAQENKSEWDRKRGQQQELVQGTIAEAEQVCPRVEVPPRETFQSLETKLQRLQKERQDSERELGGSEVELLRAANVAKKTLKEAKDAVAEMVHIEKVLMKALSNRRDRWQVFRDHISMRARVVFGYLLSERNFRGHLDLDHLQQLLDIKVEPDITKRNDAGRQTKTLSGGEKSFSTICLLLALWDAMGSPIRCLDEFDVFMDSVNREISMKMMIGAARRSVGRQYILITPQAMSSGIKNEGDVKIIRMNDPERGQTALPYAR